MALLLEGVKAQRARLKIRRPPGAAGAAKRTKEKMLRERPAVVVATSGACTIARLSKNRLVVAEGLGE